MGRRKGPGLTRQQVIDAAVRAIEADGPDALGVSRVARELGIQPPSVYNHVGKGNALSRALFAEGNRRLLAVLKDAVRGVIDPRDQLRKLAHAIRDWAKANSSLYVVMSRVPPDNDDPDFSPIFQDMLDLFFRALGQLGVEGPEALHAVRGFRAGMHGFVLLELSGQFALPEQPEVSYRWLVETMLRGMVPRQDDT